MEQHFKIGEIADMFDTSIRALRLYDKMGLFKPGYTDETTGYRYYTADQIPVLNTILVFKSIGIRLVDIKQLFDNGIDPEELMEALQKKQEYWENQIEIARFNIENIENIRAGVMSGIEAAEKGEDGQVNAYKLSRLICLESLKVDNILSEVLWL